MQKKKNGLVTLMVALTIIFALTGCSSSNKGTNESSTSSPAPSVKPTESTSASPSKEELKPVELTWYYPQPKEQSDLSVVNDAINKITKQKINATIKLKPIDFGNYEQKVNVSIAANESFDIIWTSSWLFNFTKNQNNGAFADISGYLEQYGKELKQTMPEKFWKDAQVAGKTYAVPSYQISAKSPGFVIQKRFADKYKLDVSSIKKLEDIEPFLKKIKDGEPGITPYGVAQSSLDLLYYGYNTLFNAPPVPVVPIDGGSSKVAAALFTPEVQTYFTTIHDWYTKGFINKDSATVKDLNALVSKGNVAVFWDYTLKPGGEVDAKSSNGGNDVIFVPLTEPYFTGASSTMNAISRTSKNPERAIMFLNLLDTDQELYNILTYGIEGKHFTKSADGFVKINADAGYAPGTDWVFGNTTIGYLMEGAPADKYEKTKHVNELAKVSPYYGFNFNSDPVKVELSNLASVDAEYAAGLSSGTLDPKIYLEKYQSALKKAGMDKVVEEAQKQLDAWKQTK